MFRVKILATFAVCMLLLMATAYISYQRVVGDAIEANTKESLRGAVALAEQERRMEQDLLLAQAQYVAQGTDLTDAINASYLYPPQLTPEQQAQTEPRTELEQKGEQHLKVYERLLKYKFVFEQFAQGGGKDLRRVDRPPVFTGSPTPDLFFVTDSRGVGLAALGKDLLKWFGEDVSKTLPLINEVLVKQEPRVALVHWSFDPAAKEADKLLYQVAMVPIQTSRQEKPAGVVVLGSILNDGVASKTRQMLAGVYDTGLDTTLSTRLTEQAPHVVYFQGEEIVGSTLDSNTQSQLRDTLLPALLGAPDEMIHDLEIGEERYSARAVKLPRTFEEKVPAAVAVIANISAAQKPLRDPGTNTLLAGVVLLLIGSLLMLLFIEMFVKPIEKIESEIQGVVSGNRDHVFSYEGSNKLARGLAHQLNLMSAFLQGKPMPDEEQGGGGGNWNEMGPEGPGRPAGGGQVQGISMEDLMGKKSPPSEG